VRNLTEFDGFREVIEEDTTILYAAEMPKNLVYSYILLVAIFAGDHLARALK